MKKEYKRYNNIKNDKTIVQKTTIISSGGLAIFYKNKNNILDVEFVNAIAVACKTVFSEITHFDEVFKTKVFVKKNNKIICLIPHTKNIDKFLQYVNSNELKKYCAFCNRTSGEFLRCK